MFFRKSDKNQPVNGAEAQPQRQLQSQSKSQSIQNTEIQDVNSWPCMNEYDELMLSQDGLNHFKPYEFNQYFSLMPALKKDLIFIKEKIDSMNQTLDSADQAIEIGVVSQAEVLQLKKIKSGLEQMYLTVQRANNYYSDDAFLKWVKNFVTSYYWPNAETPGDALWIQKTYESCFKETSKWFDNNVGNTKENSRARMSF